ncbi:hypothetical protein GQ54DRAFT_260532 [Martensiomyces pterosporus]|nr:hypothetical protein GQ54DRAFT_260532 [Martensiomyces pterosporus]
MRGINAQERPVFRAPRRHYSAPPHAETDGAALDPLLSKIDRTKVSSDAVGNWLLLCSGLTLGVIGATSLMRTRDAILLPLSPHPLSTASLSMPTDEKEWTQLFLQYQRTAHYRRYHSSISLDEFKEKYWYHTVCRSLSCLLAAGFFAPMGYFLLLARKPQVAKKDWGRVAILGGLVLAHGWMGDRMMRSSEVPDKKESERGRTSVYWMLGQTTVGFFLFSDLLIFGLGVLRTRRLLCGRFHGSAHWRQVFEQPHTRDMRLYAVLVEHGVVTAGMLGALMAGTNAGQYYSQWPAIGEGRWIPLSDLWDRELGWRNVCENPALVSLMHRLAAEATFILAVATWIKARRLGAGLPRESMAWAHAMLASCGLQVALGVSTLWTNVHPDVACMHELNAYLLLVATIGLMNSTKRLPPNKHLGRLVQSLRLPSK